MKVTFRNWYDEEDFRNRIRITWMSKTLNFLDWEHEDNNLSRNFSGCYSISSLIKEANELWLNGEVIEIEEIEDNDIFWEWYE